MNRFCTLLICWTGLHTMCLAAESIISTKEVVGRAGTNRFVTPANQVLTPAGIQVDLPGLRPQAIALSPDRRLLATAGKTSDLVLLDPESGRVLQHVDLPNSKTTEPPVEVVSSAILAPDKAGQLSFTGLIFSPTGDRIYLSSVNSCIKVFVVDADHKVRGLFSIALKQFEGRFSEVPAGLALSDDGSKLYAALNLSNSLAEFDAATGKLLRQWEVGMAPFDVKLCGHKAYVSNWGGRRPDANSVTGPGGRGTKVRVDNVRFIASEGSVTIIDLMENKVLTEVLTGLHASALALDPGGRYLLVANAASDTISVLDTRQDKIIETICAKSSPADLFGASPTALAFDDAGKRLFVANGTQNAVAVFDFKPGKSKLRGFIPTGWFPGALAFDSERKALYIANIKGVGSTQGMGVGESAKHNSHNHHGTLSLVKLPKAAQLGAFTRQVLDNYRRPMLEAAGLPPRPGQPARPVPERAGEPSLIRHVLYIIKENRTYDQVLGDIPGANGDPSLCTFGQKITPNQHQFVRDFVLLDNTYCSGILSADGHQWAASALVTDYLERSFAGFPRSYPFGMSESAVDALAYSPAGFIWDNAIAHGRSLRIYGEFTIAEKHWTDSKRQGTIRFKDTWRQFTNDTGEIRFSSRPGIESLRPYVCTNTVGWDLDTPDVFRAREFIRDLRHYEELGELPQLMIMSLPNDHTSGTKPIAPTPAAQAADNDLAFGQIVEALSHSRFWKETCIFAIEDDPQSGWDHVSGYRTTAYVISPYSRRGAVVSTQYNQTSLIRTMELILGLPPMNIFDATATPMADCFTTTPDLTPYTTLTNNVPLDEFNPAPKQVSHPQLRKDAYVSAKLPLDKPDQCPDMVLNRILWRALKGPQTPYPEWASTAAAGDTD